MRLSPRDWWELLRRHLPHICIMDCHLRQHLFLWLFVSSWNISSLDLPCWGPLQPFGPFRRGDLSSLFHRRLCLCSSSCFLWWLFVCAISNMELFARENWLEPPGSNTLDSVVLLNQDMRQYQDDVPFTCSGQRACPAILNFPFSNSGMFLVSPNSNLASGKRYTPAPPPFSH